MNNASLELGGTNWAEKDGNILGYSVGDTSGKYSPQEFTFARGSNLSATRIDRAGLIVKGRENVFLQSNQFDTTWLNASTTETSGQSGYDGSSDAWLLTKNGGGGYIYQNISQSGVTTFSIYVKEGTSSWVRIVGNTSSFNGGYFDLANGVTGNVENAIDTTIESVGNGWYRCSVIFNGSTTRVRVYPAEANSVSANTGNILIQDAQLEQGLAASPYIETTTTTAQAGVLENTPRLNYTTGVANPYLLLEPSRTNLVTQSEYFDSSEWGQYVFNGASLTRTFGYQSPEGNNNAYKFDVVVGTGGVLLTDNITVNPADSQTLSVWMKGENGGEKVRLSLRNSSSAGTSAGVTTLTNEWVRYDVTLSTDDANRGFQFRMLISDGVSDQTIYVYGAQCEAGTYPTSYIPTYSVSATRAADNCSKTNASGEIGQTEGVLYAEVAALANDGTYRNIALSDGSLTNRILIQYTPNANQINIVIIFSGGQYSLNHTVSNVTEFNKIAIKYKAGDNALWINGFEVDTDTNTLLPSALNTLSFDNTIGDAFYSKTKALVLYKEALTDTQLATLTTI